MLDDDDVDRAGELADLLDRALGLGRAHAAGRLVEQQQPRLGNHRHADLEQRHVAVGERAGLPAGERRKADLLERALHGLGCRAIRRRRAERMQEAVPGALGDPEVLRDRELREHALDLQACA